MTTQVPEEGLDLAFTRSAVLTPIIRAFCAATI